MCAICGYFDPSGNSQGYEEVVNAMNAMFHRGPDDNGVISINRSAGITVIENKNEKSQMHDAMFGFQRLSIKDLSVEGHQPMISAEGTVAIVFNGEIYNDSELRVELCEKGYRFRGGSDTEVLLTCYQEYGFEETLKRINGMFAFVIVDMRAGAFYMARDRFGIKPIYYCLNEGMFSFASELKGLISFHNVKREIDIDAYNARIVFSRPSDRVLIKGVSLLDPGCWVKIDFDGKVSQKRYWDINQYERTSDKYKSIDEAIDALDEVLERAVKRQIISDVPVGCQVSGGIDSTLISYYANKTGDKRIKDGISIVDTSDTGKNEEYYIDQVGKTLNLEIHKCWMDELFFINNYEYAFWCNDAPIYKPFFLSFYLLAKEAKNYVTVLLSGEGSDETAGGYGRFAAGVLFPFILNNNISSKDIRLYKSFAEYEVMSDSTITGFYTEGYDRGENLIIREIERFNSFSGSNLTKQLKYETMYRLPESCLRQDKMTMAASVENRVPLLDNEVVDMMMELPEHYLIAFKDTSPLKIGSNPFLWVEGKYIYKKLLERKFGRNFVYRKKGIMVFDEKEILGKKVFREKFLDEILPGISERGMIDATYIQNLYSRLPELNKDEFNLLWRCIGLETWTRQFIDGKHPK